MATPLTALSKYTGVFMAVLCAVLMFTFVLGDSISNMMGGGPGGSTGGGDTVAIWDGGQINERQLADAVIHRNILAQFQQSVEQAGALAARDAGVDLEYLQRSVQPLQLPRTREQGVERSVVTTKIFAQKAREAGMVVSDEMIISYLRALGFERVSNDQMREILTRMGRGSGGGGRATIGFVFDLLREAMLANNYLSSHTFAFRTILPEERWEDWKKVNERIVVEAAPVKTAAFIDEVPEPSEEELVAFYEEHRDRQPLPDLLRGYGNLELPSPTPGFAVPPRVRVTYLKADFNAVVDSLMGEVTDEEIAAYYEANKESFVEADRALFGDESGFGDDGEFGSGGGVFGPDNLLQSDEAMQEEAAVEDEGPLPFGDNAPDQEEPADEPADKDASEEAADKTEQVVDESTEAVEEEEEEEEEATADTAPATEEAPEADSAEEAAEEPAADAKPYQPLEEVADEIRQRLATERAAERMQEKVNRIKLQLDDQFVEYFDAILVAQENGEEAPAAPDSLANLQPLAEQEQLELTEVDQASQLQLRETDFGRTVATDLTPSGPIWFLAFRSEGLDLYQPFVSYDIDGNRYICLITERYEGETPKLEDVREQVVAAWKRVQAAELSEKKAEEVAAQITESGKTIADYFAQADEPLVPVADVQETDTFSLLSLGRIAPNARQVPLRLSQPEPLVAAGPELLEAAFGIEPGEVIAHLNHDHSIAYLLRIAQRIGTEDELRSNFIRDGDRWVGAGPLMQARAQNKISALLGDLLEGSGLDWTRLPDRTE
ncbi:periplasmic folding chaperone [Planctomycetes bacterium MalM25]|nr:periplasmic folding chaperone [Planctomycetes bacterium MalM25]